MGHLASFTDESLLQSAILGREDAWRELVDRYHAKGIGYIRRQINDPHVAQDIMQNLWAALIQAVRRAPPENLGALFWTLLKRRLIDELRRKGRNKEAAILDTSSEQEGSTLLERQAGDSPDPLAVALRSEEASLLQQALARLPDHYRVVLVARHLEGRSNREAAQLLLNEGLVSDDGNVEKRVENYNYRGLKELKRQLQALGYNGGGSAT